MRGIVSNIASLFLLSLCTLLVIPVSANDVESLLSEGRLRVNTSLVPADNIQARQKVTLNIRIDTDTRFAGGTRVGRVTVENAIALQRNQFAVNSTFNEGGKSWASQLWQLEIFPLDAGEYVIPAIQLDLTISTGAVGESVSGEVYTQTVAFSVAKPTLLADIDEWVASDRFSVTESYDKPIDVFMPGDALVRTITMEVNDIPAMMLPEVTTAEVQGLSVYQKPAQVNDRSNRGQSTGTRRETITYVFEQPGEYLIPELSFYWWNTAYGTLELVTLPEQRFAVEGDVVETDSAEQKTETDTPLDMQQLGHLALWLAGIATALWVMSKIAKVIKRLARWRKQQALKPPTQQKLARRFKQACEKQDAQLALSILYQWADTYAGAPYQSALRPALRQLDEQQALALFNDVTNTLYNQNQGAQYGDLTIFAEHILAITHKQTDTRFRLFKPVKLTLN